MNIFTLTVSCIELPVRKQCRLRSDAAFLQNKMTARANIKITFKQLHLNGLVDLELISQECSLGDPLPKVLN